MSSSVLSITENKLNLNYTFFYKNTIPASAEEQSLIFNKSSEQNSSKCRTICKVYFASYLFTYNCSSQLREHIPKLHIVYLLSWRKSIFSYKLKTIEAEENP